MGSKLRTGIINHLRFVDDVVVIIDIMDDAEKMIENWNVL